MKTWKIGIIGTGMIADFHAQAVQSLPNVKLAGFSQRTGLFLRWYLLNLHPIYQ
jgi:predicted dehydrogenase